MSSGLRAPATVPGVLVGRLAVRAGQLSPREWVEACLDRIAERDADVIAWAHVDADGARARADAIHSGVGPLEGVPIGVKDVIDVAGMPTGCNSPIEAGRVATVTAAVVSRLTAAGAIVLGKTMTAEYAFLEPAPTRNPLDLARTPGGSSSGSAAAVADGHVPITLTTQTGGSTIRPAAFCGIVGYKPPYGVVPADGLVFLSPSLDTIGLHGQSVADVATVASVMEGRDQPATTGAPPRFVRVRLPLEGHTEPAAQAMMGAAIGALRAAGATVREVDAPAAFAPLDAAHRIVMAVEVARTFRLAGRFGDPRISPSLGAFIEKGDAVSPEALAAAQAEVARGKMELAPYASAGEIFICPAAPGEAPVGLSTTGSSILNRLWSLLGTAVITIPAGLGRNGLPLGLQIVDPWPSGDRLFPAAAFAEAAIAPIAPSRAGAPA